MDCDYKTNHNMCYGKEVRDKLFLMADGFINLNHGSFGTVPKKVAESQYSYFLEQESYPDTWFRTSYYKYIDNSRNLIANYVNASVDDIVLVENASSAMNAILRSLGLKVLI